jgi:hypothetical protein
MSDSSSAILEENNTSVVIEPVVQEPSIPVQTFVDIVKKTIENEVVNDKIKMILSPEVKNVINNLISLTPDTLTDIEKAIVDIVKDNKIDSKDIPNLIIVIQRIYQFIYSLGANKFDAKKRAEITAASLKFVIRVLLLNDKIKLNPEKTQEEFLNQIDVLIDSCVGLLSFSKTIKTPRCLKKIFG